VVGEILLIKDPTRPDVIRADRLKRSPVDSDMALIEQAVGLAQFLRAVIRNVDIVPVNTYAARAIPLAALSRALRRDHRHE
jgi:hypothetical protein